LFRKKKEFPVGGGRGGGMEGTDRPRLPSALDSGLSCRKLPYAEARKKKGPWMEKDFPEKGYTKDPGP